MAPLQRWGVSFWASLLMPVITLWGVARGGLWIAMGPAFLFIALPVADVLFGHDRINPIPGRVLERAEGRDSALWVWVPVQLMFVGAAVAFASELSVAEFFGTAFAIGLVSSAGAITAAHELMHRVSPLARGAAELLMSTVAYAHFCTEHVAGHHRHVATDADPATSRFGESLYAFWWRSLWGGKRSAKKLDAAWARRHPNKLSRTTRRRCILGVLTVGAYLVGGSSGVGLFGMQALVAILLLETINYVEHYGLQRNVDDDGRPERVEPHHSWNASQRLTNRFLFNLQRHSDHHHAASRPYWALRHHDDVPQLPVSYPAAFLMALIPPLWARVMNPRVLAWRARH